MFGNSWHKKEKPLPTIIGLGGGATGLSQDIVKAVLEATGGSTVEPGNGYKYHVFTSPGSFDITPATIPAVPTGTYEVLIVGGGGCGGFSADSVSGGGGAGGIVHYTGFPLPAGNQDVVIGPGQSVDGNNAGPDNGATSGTDTTFGPPTVGRTFAKGGGSGAEGANNSNGTWKSPGRAGGSGGGGIGYIGSGAKYSPGGPGTQPAQSLIPGAGGTNYGKDGSDGGPSGDKGGGGGGAGGSSSAPTNENGGNGQPFPSFASPLISPLIPGPAATAIGPTGLFGGGGAASGGGPPYGTGGPGGGGPFPSDAWSPTRPAPNRGLGDAATGYGSGGSGSQVGAANALDSAAGAPGIVIIRYLY